MRLKLKFPPLLITGYNSSVMSCNGIIIDLTFPSLNIMITRISSSQFRLEYRYISELLKDGLMSFS